ncbi:hypothetical protein [Acidovorax facilis]|uniref:hypothetical protein n=1 Tax=Acidovorax facilis TaxID=12917 RepID=UPI003D65880A
MKHAGVEALKRIEPLLAQVRAFSALVERRPGVFYLRSRAFLHFHEDSTGIFADVRIHDSFERFDVSDRVGEMTLTEHIRSALAKL